MLRVLATSLKLREVTMSKVLGIKELCEFWQAIKSTIAVSEETILTVSDFFTVNSTNAKLTDGRLRRYGKVVEVTITWENKAAISVPASGNIGNIEVGTFVSTKRPAIASNGLSHGDNAGQAWYNIGTNGILRLGAVEGTGSSRTIAADTTFNFFATYILP